MNDGRHAGETAELVALGVPAVPVLCEQTRLRTWHPAIVRVVCATLAAGAWAVAEAQTKDDFGYWDANWNGDLTCAEVRGRDEGLKLPAY